MSAVPAATVPSASPAGVIPDVGFDVDFARRWFRRGERPRRVILRLAEGTVPIPRIAEEEGVTPQAVYSIAERAVRDGLLTRIPGRRPCIFRPGARLLERVQTPAVSSSELSVKSPPVRHGPVSPLSFTLRVHALQVSLPVLSLDRADLSAWTAGKPSPVGRTYTTRADGLALTLHGRSVLVVSVPALVLEVTVGTLGEAEARFRAYVAERVTLARKVAHERYGVVAGAPGTWYRPPHFGLERYPAVPEGVAYDVTFWVDSSLGPSEAESSSIETTRILMAAANDLYRDLALSTF